MIAVLDETTVGQIAAGEVVERPLSVVKELVENALDAGAGRIAVAIERGGLAKVEVADDGAGIPAGQLQLAFMRHATSKLSGAEELTRVTTLGFRGEGLASIAAVARVRLTSRTAQTEVGYALDAFEGTFSEVEPVAAPLGTRVVVRDLFANVPARREYMRTAAAEFARISTFLATLALGYPSVGFTLSHDGRPAWSFAAGGSLAERLAHVFGTAQARELIELDAVAPDGKRPGVRGFISRPGNDRPDRRMQLLFVNGRLLRSTAMAGAWTAGYATFALSHRQPFGVLFLEVAPGHVDPNVHPTKSDVRLRHAAEAGEAVRRAIGATLARDASSRLRAALSFAPAGASGSFEANVARANGTPEPFAFAHANGAHADTEELRILAQLDDAFILATDGNALVLVDQHAAHERVAYEAIVSRAAGDPRSEPLLIPYTIELERTEAVRFAESLDALHAAGLDVEPFGERAYRVLATPAGYGARAFDVRGYLEDLADEIPGLDARQRIWASLACHSVVRAGDPLEPAEMSALLARLQRCANPMHCPHGRPTVVRIEADEIGRMFKRSW